MITRKRLHIAALFVSALIASCVLWLALEHNPQGAYYGSELGTDWGGILFLWASAFAFTLVPQIALIWASWGIWRWFRHHSR